MLLRSERRPLAAACCGAALGMAVLCHPTVAVVGLCTAAYLLCADRRRRAAFVPATPLAFGQSVVASGIALSKTGSANLWQSSWRESLPGLLFSPAPGLVWFSPVLVLGLVSAAAVWRHPRFRALIPLQLATVLMILVAGKWFDWWGGLTWGYRSIIDAFIERIIASRPLRVLCGVLLAWSIAVQFLGAYSYSLIGWSDLWREYDRPEHASLWRWDQPQIGYHLAHFSSERARTKQVMATYLNHPGPILNVPTKASGSTLGSH